MKTYKAISDSVIEVTTVQEVTSVERIDKNTLLEDIKQLQSQIDAKQALIDEFENPEVKTIIATIATPIIE
jgi:hypothetical protein